MALRARTLLAAVAAACAMGCSGTLWLANGLDEPVQVSVAGKTVRLEPNERKSISVRPGVLSVETTTLDGKGREALQVEVPGWGDTSVYNVAGAAPLYSLTVWYAAKSELAQDARSEVLCGRRTVVQSFNHYFEQPPKSVELSNSQSVATRTVLLAANGGWQTCVAMLESEDKERAAAELVQGMRAIHDSPQLAGAEASLRWASGDEAGGLELMRNTASASRDRDVHYYYQHFAIMSGKREELRREYQARAERQPDDPELRFTAARLLPLEERIQALRAFANAHPDDPDALLALTWNLCTAGRFAEVLPALEPLGDGAKLEGDNWTRLLRRRVWALAGLGRTQEAVELLRAAALKKVLDEELVVVQGQLAVKLGRPDMEPDPRAIDVGDDDERAWRRLTYNSQVHPELLTQENLKQGLSNADVIPVLVKGQVDPAAALAHLHRLSHYHARLVPEPLALALIGEAWAIGDDKAEKRLRHRLVSAGVDFEALRAYVVEGRPTGELAELGDDRATIHLARSRKLRVEGDAAAAAAEEELVRRYDPYGGVATHALSAWHPPAGAAHTLRLASATQADRVDPARDRRREKKAPPAIPADPPPKPATTEYRLTRMEGVRLERAP